MSQPREPGAHDSPSWAGLAREGGLGSLRGRLLWAFVGVVALAAVIIGVVTFSLVRVAASSGVEQQLSDQAEAISTGGTLLGQRQGCVAITALRAVQTELYLVDSQGTPHLPSCAPLRDRLRGATAVAPAPDIDLLLLGSRCGPRPGQSSRLNDSLGAIHRGCGRPWC